MCGIVGVASVRPWKDRPPLVHMTKTLQHRGPDDAGEWWSDDGRVGLGHRRLAILDLSSAGHQPMRSSDGHRMLAFNGEIYNHGSVRSELHAKGLEFRSSSDTEVVLRAYEAWGHDSLRRLRGMFALAIVDLEKGLILLARDRAGEKPLFYRTDGTSLYFASELKALFRYAALDRRICSTALDSFLAHGYTSGSECLVEGFRKLEPGTFMEYSIATGQSEHGTFWSLPKREVAHEELPQHLLMRELRETLECAVAEQLVADVPVGVMLSGGVDSSIIAALASRVSPSKVRTFSVAFPGYAKYDETRYAAQVANWLDTEHLVCEAKVDATALLPQLVRQYDEPIADSSMIPTFLVARAIREHCTVALGGDGGDELFGGYKLYQVMLWQQLLRDGVPGWARALASELARELPIGFPGRTYIRGLSLPRIEAVARVGEYFDLQGRRNLSPLLREARLRTVTEQRRMASATEASTLVDELTRADFVSYLPDDILVKVDRASMLNALEVRAPFLDQRVIEFAFRKLPCALRASRAKRKVALRLLAHELLPADFDVRRKQGFSIPINSWLRERWGDEVRSILSQAPAALFSQVAIASLFDGLKRGRNNGQRIYTLLMLELWRREYGISL